MNSMKRKLALWLACIIAVAAFVGASAQAAPAEPGANPKPNIVVIFGDDIGLTNVSAYSFGLMGYKTPNIDRVAKEGMMFTDYYAEQSCTAGRSSFITGQATLRTGLSKVGLPAASVGLQADDITIAQALKPLGYVTGQFGKNHLGDRNEYLPTAHGFDEFFGNLYHLNAEEEPEDADYPKDPAFKEKFGPRGVIKSFATDTEDQTVDPRWGKVGKQKIEDTGPLTKKRMETIDDETVNAAIDFMKRAVAAGKPFFLWWNGTRMHLYTHVRPEMLGRSGISEYFDGMLEHDDDVGKILKAIDDLGVADNTILIYTTDNGPHMNSWPDGAMTPFRGEKNTNWEGAFRVPAMIRWPGHIKPGSVSNEIISGLDWFPTLLAAAGDPDIKEKLLNGYDSGGRTFKNHLDGYNQLAYLTGAEPKSARKEFFYFNDDGQLVALRYNNWKFNFCEQRVEGTLKVWSEPFVCLRLPTVINLRMDPYERAPITSNTYYDWSIRHAYLVVPTQSIVGDFIATFKEFPPRQRPSSFSVDQVMEVLQKPQGG
jgi:arylsulfatase